jgi:predicted ATPase/energy-coupling factor transporter ATP-binding protein EcfA2
MFNMLSLIDRYLKETQNKRIVVFIGGGFAGKTTLIETFERMGFGCLEEQALILVRELTDCLGGIENMKAWRSQHVLEFQIEIARRQITAERKLETGLIFSDRGLLDGFAYFELSNLSIPTQLKQLAKNINYKTVFLCEQIPNFTLRVSTGRIHSKQEALKLACSIERIYRQHGYKVISLPPVSVPERVAIINDVVICDFVFERSMATQMAEYNLRFVTPSDRKALIFLFGTKGAGKTTIARMYLKLYPDAVLILRSQRSINLLYSFLIQTKDPRIIQTYSFFNKNTYYYSQNLQIAKKIYSEQYLLQGLELIKDFVNRHMYQIYYEEDKQVAELAQALLTYGLPVISDNIFRSKQALTQPDLSAYMRIKYKVILVYANPDDLIRHITCRNQRLLQQSELGGIVDIRQININYASFFKLRRISPHSNQDAIARLKIGETEYNVLPRFFKPDIVINTSSYDGDTEEQQVYKLTSLDKLQ